MVEISPEVFLSLLPDDFTMAIGRVVSQWAWTDAFLDQGIWKLMGVNHGRGRAVTSNLMSSTKIDVLATLMRLRKYDEAVVKKLEATGKDLAPQRNLVAHAYAAQIPHIKDVLLVSFSARGELTDRSRMASPGDIDALAKRIAEFNGFLSSLHGILPRGRQPKPRQPKSLTPSAQRRRLRTIAPRLPLRLGEQPAQEQGPKKAKPPKKMSSQEKRAAALKRQAERKGGA